MDDGLFPESRIFPDVFRKLSPTEVLVLRFLLANPTAGGRLPAMNSLVFSQLVEKLYVKLRVTAVPAIVLRCVRGNPHPGQPAREWNRWYVSPNHSG